MSIVTLALAVSNKTAKIHQLALKMHVSWHRLQQPEINPISIWFCTNWFIIYMNFVVEECLMFHANFQRSSLQVPSLSFEGLP